MGLPDCAKGVRHWLIYGGKPIMGRLKITASITQPANLMSMRPERPLQGFGAFMAALALLLMTPAGDHWSLIILKNGYLSPTALLICGLSVFGIGTWYGRVMDRYDPVPEEA